MDNLKSHRHGMLDILRDIADAVVKAVGLIPGPELGKDIEMGADGTPTSEVDKVAENTVLDYIVRNNVPLNVLSEEIGYVDNGFEDTLVLDPIDGTSNAIAGVPMYTVSMAVGKSRLSDVRYAYLRNVMTGESMPVDKGPGDPVSSGTVNQFGAFEIRAMKVGEDSSIQRMIRLVQSADAGKATIVGLADRWATWIVIIALTASAGTFLVTREIIRAVTILVVFCPCALVLATPTAIMAAIGNATKHGFLVREGDALERLASVSKITFDKLFSCLR